MESESAEQSSSPPTTPKSLNQTNILIAVVVIIVVLIGIFAWLNTSDRGVEQAEENATKALDIIEGVGDNPIEAAPDLNPAQNTNPFTDVYKNPFD